MLVDADDLEELAFIVLIMLVALELEEPWRRDAACREHRELDWYRPSDATRAVCASCLVRAECPVAHGPPRVYVRAPRPSRARAHCDKCGAVLVRGSSGTCWPCKEARVDAALAARD